MRRPLFPGLVALVALSACSKGNQIAHSPDPKPAPPAPPAAPASPWKLSVSKDPLTDAVTTTESVTNAAGQTLGIGCLSQGDEGKPSRVVLLLDKRIQSAGNQWHDVLIRIGQKKAFADNMLAKEGTLGGVEEKSDFKRNNIDFNRSMSGMMTHIVVADLSDAKSPTDTLLARYEQGDDTINHFNQERHLVSREIYKERRDAALAAWRTVAE